ncbi:MAG: ABC transporter substrate-binding protein [Candidatus Binatia bacterium]|nr:ABC transporter substrate-binding protein [Candidatus Binatia bacterium]
MRDLKTWKILSLSLVCISIATPVIAGIPTDRIRQTADQVLVILQDPRLKSESSQKERREQLRQTISARFDFGEMAKRCLGPHWQRATPGEQQEFVMLFTDLLQSSYADQIEAYNGEKIVYSWEKQDKDSAEVDTKIVKKNGEELPVNYKLDLANGDWKVYDVIIENISLVNNYRSQFNHVLAKSSINDLLNRMRSKQFDAPGKK